MKAYSAKDLWAYEDMLYTLQSALNTAKVYEVLTKDEVIAMLEDTQSEIEDCIRQFGGSYKRGFNTALLTVEYNIIQKRINALKAESEDGDENVD